MITHGTISKAMAARYAARQARIHAATAIDHTPRPVNETTATALLAATGHTADGITISSTHDGALIAIGHHSPAAFMAAAHNITRTNDDPFGLLDTLYAEIFNGGIEFADMADWGTEDIWHANAVVIQHGHADGTPGIPDPADCHCINHAWATREAPAGSDGAIAVTVYQPGAGDNPRARYADHFGPEASDR